ncbi:GH92 family glycosyl hydrolase [Niabella beijingensis]|uniref:GH92 family glycosyl hydrolase n=1 Tax=Niabella beijingensis TaxID=2872700 RepID=UPI001CBF0F0D|nr:GH92 family glycosyl hydrolase [Niabella beijingensis]MBZ4192275.1 GH92 family glycosyl hydrolase [Niabella beijingensis]
MRFSLSILFISLFALGGKSQNINEKITEPVGYVNTLMGTASKHALSNGNTYPAIGMPWGMHLWTPQTGKMGDGWAYTYDAEKIVGFKQTHQPSPWMNDYGQFAIMPFVGSLRFKEDRGSWFSHKAETATPYYYKVYLADYNVTTEIAPTERAAIFRLTFPQSDSAYIAIDAMDGGAFVQIIPEERKIIGYSRKSKLGIQDNFKNYFVIYVDHDFDVSYTWNGKQLDKTNKTITSEQAGAVIGFKTKKDQQVHLKVASSFISFEQAEITLKRELSSYNLEQVAAHAKKVWNDKLSRISVQGGQVDDIRTFYSCLYRMLQFPQKHYEIDAKGQPVHYSPYNGQVVPGYLFAGTGFWDTFRALYPFLNLMFPSINKEMQEGLINAYKEGGWLPEWSSPGYRNTMIGNNSAAVVADAYLKGLRGYDIQTLYEAMLKGANNEGPLTAVGRKGAAYYNKLGYVPYDVDIRESAARTLEYAYSDFTIAQLAKTLERPKKEIELYRQRALNYKNLFDDTTKLMRGRNADGSFQYPFNPFKWGDAFTEGNSWHYSWSVFHDISGLIRLMGGEKMFMQMLDSVFTLPPVFDESYYGKVIHEIREMQIMNMGQYAHGNQPIQHMTYLYNYAGAPWKSQFRIREVMKRLYKPTPDGYCGDEDNGQTSAWYVFSALGFYPVCPATTQYVLGTPLFKKATLFLENGKTFTISAPNNSSENLYINTAAFNGKSYDKNWIDHFDIMKGGTFRLQMSNVPNRQKGTAADDYPYSFSTDKSS